MRTPRPGAASVSLAQVLTGPTRTVTVTASLPTALYLSTLDPDTPAICLAAADAVRVPCALVLGPGTAVPTAAVGSAALVGEGRVQLGSGGTSAAVTRWWRPSRPHLRLPNPDAVERALDVIGSAVVVPVAPVDAAVCAGTGSAEAGVARLAETLAAAVADPALADPALADPALADPALGDPALGGLALGGLAGPVRALLGRGPGLTPLGDDVLAGALVTLHAAGHPLARALTTAVTSALATAPATVTTPVSAALLAHAGRGECVPQLAAVLDAIAAGGTDRLRTAAVGLLGVGHSSGGGLLLGVEIVLASNTGHLRRRGHPPSSAWWSARAEGALRSIGRIVE